MSVLKTSRPWADRPLPLSQLRFLEKRWRDTAKIQPWMRRLRKILLDHDGLEVVFRPIDPALAGLLLSVGAFRDGHDARLVPGAPSQCHDNSARMVEEHPETRSLMTGYALSDDGLWRRHSWVVENEEMIIETTEPRYCYYGVQVS